MLGKSRYQFILFRQNKAINDGKVGFDKSIPSFPPDSIVIEFSENAEFRFCLRCHAPDKKA